MSDLKFEYVAISISISLTLLFRRFLLSKNGHDHPTFLSAFKEHVIIVSKIKTCFRIKKNYRLYRQTKTSSSIATVANTPITIPTTLLELESVKY